MYLHRSWSTTMRAQHKSNEVSPGSLTYMTPETRHFSTGSLVRGLRRSKFARSATWMFHGQGIQLLSQFAYFVAVAHALGPKGYGTFVACTAVVMVLAPFGPWGAGQVMMKYAARRRETLPTYFGNAIAITLFSGTILGAILLLLRPYILPPSVPVLMLASVAFADLICTQLTAVCSLAFMALDLHRKSAQVLITSSVLRVVASLILLATSSSAAVWAYLYLSAAIISVVIQIFQVARASSAPRVQLVLLRKSFREGFHFATSSSAQTIYDNIDKGMLARLSSVEAAAIYAVAYRFVDASVLPIRSLAAATYPEFFRKGEGGVAAAFDFAKRILRKSVVYGLMASILLYLFAGFVPVVMGHKFAESAVALRWLCPLPFIKSIHAFLNDTLTGGDQQAARSVTQLSLAGFNILINLWLIRVFSWRGASVSSIITDLGLAISLYIVIRWYLRKESASRERGMPAVETVAS